MGAVKVEDKEKYFETSRTWEYDRMRAAIQSKRLAWGVATGACALAVVSVGAVVMLAPLTGGYSLIQIAVLYVTMTSIGIANVGFNCMNHDYRRTVAC